MAQQDNDDHVILHQGKVSLSRNLWIRSCTKYFLFKNEKDTYSWVETRYRSFVVAIQGWPIQPSLVELKNLLVDQEALVKQMVGVSLKSDKEALFSGHYKDWPKRRFNAGSKNRNNEDREDEKSSQDRGA